MEYETVCEESLVFKLVDSELASAFDCQFSIDTDMLFIQECECRGCLCKVFFTYKSSNSDGCFNPNGFCSFFLVRFESTMIDLFLFDM